MKSKSKLSIYALQQKLSRPGATVVLTVFTLGYFLYLTALLVINMQKGWYVTHEQQGWNSFNEIYTFEYYFKSYDYSIDRSHGLILSNSTTPHKTSMTSLFRQLPRGTDAKQSCIYSSIIFRNLISLPFTVLSSAKSSQKKRTGTVRLLLTTRW